MTEIEIFRQIAEGLGIGALVLISGAWIVTRAISAYSANTKERNNIELKRLENERLDRESAYKEKATFADVTRDLGAKSQAIADTLKDVAGIVAILKDENKTAIEATKSAEANVLDTLTKNHNAQSESIKSLSALILELQALIKANPTSEALNTRLDAIVSAFNDAILKLENRLINELTRIKLHETIHPVSMPNVVSDSFDARSRDDTFTAPADGAS